MARQVVAGNAGAPGKPRYSERAEASLSLSLSMPQQIRPRLSLSFLIRQRPLTSQTLYLIII
jgi:hypothetical protein